MASGAGPSLENVLQEYAPAKKGPWPGGGPILRIGLGLYLWALMRTFFTSLAGDMDKDL